MIFITNKPLTGGAACCTTRTWRTPSSIAFSSVGECSRSMGHRCTPSTSDLTNPHGNPASTQLASASAEGARISGIQLVRFPEPTRLNPRICVNPRIVKICVNPRIVKIYVNPRDREVCMNPRIVRIRVNPRIGRMPRESADREDAA